MPSLDGRVRRARMLRTPVVARIHGPNGDSQAHFGGRQADVVNENENRAVLIESFRNALSSSSR